MKHGCKSGSFGNWLHSLGWGNSHNGRVCLPTKVSVPPYSTAVRLHFQPPYNSSNGMLLEYHVSKKGPRYYQPAKDWHSQILKNTLIQGQQRLTRNSNHLLHTAWLQKVYCKTRRSQVLSAPPPCKKRRYKKSLVLNNTFGKVDFYTLAHFSRMYTGGLMGGLALVQQSYNTLFMFHL